jgi:pyruvate kinase
LSFVNDARDIENLQQFIRLTIKDRQEIKEKLCWMDNQELKFPIIAKIETEEGIAHLGDIMDASYGILVARGDLALRTGIETVGILQKDIIDKCVAEGKPAITATQMLLSMMDFIEPRRSEVTDVTNAVQDGSDALMLSEETADPDSKYPTESIRMMANIISKTEERRSSDRLDYKYEIDKQHEKALKSLKDDRIKLKEKLERHSMTAMQYDLEDQQFQRMENTEHVSYDACKTAFELKCKAIVVLTDTGGTARMVSRFGPDAPILAGVYKDRIARILRLSYGVETFRITSNPQGYPFAEFEAVIRQARDSGVLEEGDRVILVAGYPPKQPGTTTLLNIYEVGRTEDSIPSMASKRQ